MVLVLLKKFCSGKQALFALLLCLIIAQSGVVSAVNSVTDYKFIVGSCSFQNQWTNSLSCMEFRERVQEVTEEEGEEGDVYVGELYWDVQKMTERCNIESDSTLSIGEACPYTTVTTKLPSGFEPEEESELFIGWCITSLDDMIDDDIVYVLAIEAQAMTITDRSPDVPTNKLTCEVLINGTFEAAATTTITDTNANTADGDGDIDVDAVESSSSNSSSPSIGGSSTVETVSYTHLTLPTN